MVPTHLVHKLFHQGLHKGVAFMWVHLKYSVEVCPRGVCGNLDPPRGSAKRCQLRGTPEVGLLSLKFIFEHVTPTPLKPDFLSF